MSKRVKQKTDLATILFDFQKRIFHNRPSLEKMVDEIRMMHFKIRPVQGDISLLNLLDVSLIETLWNLGKLDEFYRGNSRRFTKKDKEMFFRFFENLHSKFQKDLSRVKLVASDPINLPPVIEMEIYREELGKRKIN